MLEAEETKNNKSYVISNMEATDMKNITKRNDGRYMLHIQKNGNRIYAYADTLRQAQLKLKRLKKESTSYVQKKLNYTLREWSNYWIETYKSPFIKIKNCNVIKQLFNEINKKLGNININKLTAIQIQEFYNTYKTSRKKEKIILYLNACLQKANDLQIITINPCKSVVKDRKLKFEKTPFSVEEQSRILKAIKNTEIEQYILFYLLTGIRKNEINNKFIENGDLDIKNNRIRVINEKQHSNLVSYKYIDLNSNYVNLLTQNKEKFTLSTDMVYKRFKETLKNLGIQGGLHTLRHTFATNYYYLGVPEKLISTWLGHKSLNITQDIYIGIQRKNIKEELIKLYNNLLYEF